MKKSIFILCLSLFSSCNRVDTVLNYPNAIVVDKIIQNSNYKIELIYLRKKNSQIALVR